MDLTLLKQMISLLRRTKKPDPIETEKLAKVSGSLIIITGILGLIVSLLASILR